MASTAVGWTRIYLVSVIDAPADCVALDYLDTHVGSIVDGVLSEIILLVEAELEC